MRRLIFALLMLVVAVASHAQNCPRGMLQISGPASYVSTQSVQALNLTHGFTIECWVQPDVPLHAGGIVDKGTHGVSFYGIFVDTGGLYLGAVKKTSSIKISSPPVASFGQWHHIAYTFRPGDSIYLYIDSFEVASASAKNISVIDSTIDSLRIGLSAAGVSFIGSIDEFRVWGVPRRQGQIDSNLYGIVAPDPSLVLYYSFDDGIGYRRIHDFSGHGHDGYLQGQNVTILQSTSPVLDASPGWQLASKEDRIVIPTRRCVGAFDTVIHIHNIGPRPDTIKAYAFGTGRAFTIISNFPIALPADSSRYVPIDLHFEPRGGGVFDDTLSIIDSNECGGTLRIGVRATYDSVGLAFSPSVLNFDSVLTCSLPAIGTVTVTNVSVTDSVTLVAPNLPPGLALLTTLPRRLGPKESIILSFALLPGARGPVSMQTGITLDKCSRTAFLTVEALRQQPQWSVPANIDFGSVSADLNGITKDTMIVVRNTGNVSTTIKSVTVSDTSVTILDARDRVVRAPGDTLQIHLRVHPQSCGHVSAMLHVIEPLCGTDTAVLVSINIPEPLPLRMMGFDAGRICPSQSVRRSVIVSNPNERAVRLDTISFSKDYVFFNQFFDTSLTLIPPHDSIQVEFLFQPAFDGDFVDTAYLHMSPCGTAIAILRGSRGYPGLTFDGSPLSFGRGCDTTTVTKIATLTNHSSRAVTIDSTMQTGSSRFHIAPVAVPFIMLPGDSKAFEITYAPTLGALDIGSLTLRASEGCDAITLSLRGSRELAKATFTSTVLDFDTVCPGVSKTKTITLKNLGLDTIDIQSILASGHGFALDSASNILGDSVSIRLRYTGYLLGADTGTLLVALDRCGTTLLLPLRGMTGPAPAIIVSDSVLDVGSVKVGASGVRCVTISNPSCSSLPLRIDTAALAPFTSDWDSATIAPGQSMKLCLTFAPTVYGASARTLRISSDSAPTSSVTLKGLGLAPDVHIAERTLDFGYVLRGSSKMLLVHLTNVGNDTAKLSATNSYSEYVPVTPIELLPSASDVIAVTFSPKQNTGLLLDTLVVSWNGHYDTVFLRGQGTEAGMIASATALNFGDVHVTDSKTLPLYITATQDFPTVQSVTLLAGSSPAFSESAVVPHTVLNDHDTLAIGVTYHPLFEQRDTGYLLVSDGVKIDTILLAGRGVEAHVRVNPVLVDYGDVVINTSLSVPSVLVTNTGTYRVFVTNLSIAPDFSSDITSDPVAIEPDSQRAYIVTFTPMRARRVVDSLYITTTSPDKIAPIALAGTGIYPSGTGPSFGYRIASTQTSPGKRDTISVSIYGTRLAKIDADSLKLELTYDPSMLLMHGIISDFPHRMAKTSDSTIECIVMTNVFPQGALFSLDAEALLGPNLMSYIHIKRDEPHGDIAEAVGDGLYQVIDCGGSEHGVVFGNGYQLQSISPNPASDALKIAYKLGFAGLVTIDLYDDLGRTVKHFESLERDGAHAVSIDVSSLPAGRYVYRLASLDFKASGSVLLVR